MAKKKNHRVDQEHLFKGKASQIPEGYYSGEKPNLNLRKFVEDHLENKPYHPLSDKYSVKPDLGSIKVSKRNPVYALHGYDSKKPPEAVQKYIEHFTKEGDLVFDPFVGSGMTAIACLRSRRKCVASDLSPLATFITSQYCFPIDPDRLHSAADRVLVQVQEDRNRLYTTTCGRCGGKAEIYYTVYSQTYQCARCMSIVSLFDALGLDQSVDSGKKEFDSFCPICAGRGITEKISTRQKRYGYLPVMIEYQCECSPNEHIVRKHNDSNESERTIFADFDLASLREIDKTPPKHWYPTRPMLWMDEDQGPWGVLWRPYHGSIRRVDQFFTHRNLDALSCLLASIKEVTDVRIGDSLKFIFSGFLLSQSKLQRFHPSSTFPNMIAPGLLYVAPIIKEYNAFQWFGGKVKSSLKGFAELQGIDPMDVLITTESATDMWQVPSNSMDYIFTDPPYGGRIQYGELNFIQEAWLGFDTDWRREEIIINSVRGKDESYWEYLMKKAFEQCYRVLKPGRWLSLCYHDSAEGTWTLVQDLLTEVGFVPEVAHGAVAIDTKEKSLKQITADKITKRDLVINFRKPKLGEIIPEIMIVGDEDETIFSEKLRQIIHEYLETHPGATKDRIYDDVVSRMVRKGEMEKHDFEALLRQVGNEVRVPVKKTLLKDEDPNLFGTHEMGRWYLKETELDITDNAESAKEDAAAVIIGKFIDEYLKEHKGTEGVHYSDVFEHYIYAVKDKPRRKLVEWLLDYFYKTESGTYRLPTSEEEEKIKAEGRKKGTNRRMKRYLSYILQGVPIPELERPSDSTLSEWIRHAKVSGMYEEGRLLYEKGGLATDRLSDQAAAEVEEDYEVCVRKLGEEK